MRRGRRCGLLLLLGAAWGCGPDAPERPTRSAASIQLRAALQSELRPPEERGAPEPAFGAAQPVPGGTVRPVALDAQPGLRVGGADFRPDGAAHRAVILAHGHFGGGKSTPEVQELAQRLVASGVRVLAIDTLGVEEWAQPGRFLHGPEAAHHRAFLLAGGSSALGLHLAGLQGGLDILEADGATEILAAGASGGAAQAFWLAMLDDRVDGVVLASPPAIPRVPGTGGCSCDLLPGRPGPDAAILAALPVPSLWLSEVEGAAPDGLPVDATWQVVPGTHGFSTAMQDAALAWMVEGRGWPLPQPAPPAGAPLDLKTEGPGEDRAHRDLLDLQMWTEVRWAPGASTADPPRYRVQCSGRGPTALVAGLTPRELTAFPTTDRRLCRLEVASDPLGEDRAAVRGEPYADRMASLVARVAREVGAIEVWAGGGWSVAAAGSGRPCTLRDPPLRPADLTPGVDPAWAHVPGIWWRGARPLWRQCEAVER